MYGTMLQIAISYIDSYHCMYESPNQCDWICIRIDVDVWGEDELRFQVENLVETECQFLNVSMNWVSY